MFVKNFNAGAPSAFGLLFLLSRLGDGGFCFRGGDVGGAGSPKRKGGKDYRMIILTSKSSGHTLYGLRMQALYNYVYRGVYAQTGGSVGGDEGSVFCPQKMPEAPPLPPPLPHPTSNICITPRLLQEAVRVVVEGDEGCVHPHTHPKLLLYVPSQLGVFERQAGFSPVDSPPP